MFQDAGGSGVTPLPSRIDVAIVGGGAAGIGAARRLAGEPASCLLLEARDRLGGRAFTLVGRSGAGIDLGCGWLHSADRNPWVAIAEDLGYHIDKTPPPWMKQAFGVNFAPQDQHAYRKAFTEFDERLAAAAGGPDRPASELMDPEQARWKPLLDAFSGYYNGAPFEEISVHDYAAYDDSGVDWRVSEGYGAAVAAAGGELPFALNTPVTLIDRSKTPLRVHTPAGVVDARTVIVAIPTTVLAEGGLKFDPPLAEKIEAAAALPLGHVDKAFLRLAEPEALPEESHLFGRTDTAETASYHLRPFGRPLIESFFGGRLAGELEREPYGAFASFALDELAALLGSDVRKILRPLTETRWGADPFSRGAYSHALPGFAGMREALARPVEDRIFFAGEACSPHAFSTAHGAYETGVAAAEAVLRALGVEVRGEEEEG
jgi:monoamine oxidase